MSTPEESFGQRIRRLRQSAGLTLQEVGKRSGIAFSTVSRVEKGQLSPTYESIVRLAQGLDVDVAELFAASAPASAAGRRSVTPPGGGVRQQTPNYEFQMLNTDLRNKQFIPIFATIKARSIAEFPAMVSHEGEEFIFVVKGAVEVHTDLYEVLHLDAGGSCYFDSQMAHAVITVSDEDAEVVWICSSSTVAEAIREQAKSM